MTHPAPRGDNGEINQATTFEHAQVPEYQNNPDAGGAREIVPADKRKNPWVKRGIATVAGALAIGVGIGVVHNNSEKSTPENSSSGASGGDRTASAPVVPGQESVKDYSSIDPNTLSQAEFFSTYPEELRIKWATEYVNEHFNESLQGLNKHLSDYNRTLLPEIVPNHLSEDSDINDILNYQAVVNWMAAKLPQNDKERVLSAIVDTESANRQDIMNNVKTDSSATWEVTVGDVVGDTAGEKRLISPKFEETPVQGYNPNGSPSYIAVITNIHLQSASEITLRYTHNQWVLNSVLSPKTDMDRWITDPTSLQVR